MELNVTFSRIWIVDETANKLKLLGSSGLYTDELQLVHTKVCP